MFYTWGFSFRFQFTIGRLPFEGENIYKLFGAISTGEFTIPTDVPYALQDLIKGIIMSLHAFVLSMSAACMCMLCAATSTMDSPNILGQSY